jgi:cbb3-type cytochrome oxidase subunit 3
MEFDIKKLRAILANHFSIEDLELLAYDFDLDIEMLPGNNVMTKATELIAYFNRRNELQALIKAVKEQRPDVDLTAVFEQEPKNPTTKDDVASLNIELASLRQQLLELQMAEEKNGLVETQIEAILKTVNRAVGRSEDLTARVILPRQEDMDVRLIPSHSLERLEEYRSDENVAYLLIGSFSGAILGVLSNWLTSEDLIITRFSIILMVILFIAMVASVLWSRKIHQRAEVVRRQIFSEKDKSERD